VVVESADHARRRGARLLARVSGWGAAADATHMTAPDRQGRGAARAMASALADAALSPSAIAFVSAHGTGTVYNDAMEAVAIAGVFGSRGVPVNSIKGAIGHTLGAAGALEVVMCLDVLRTGLVPPTAGLGRLDPACAGLDVVHDEPRCVPARAVLTTTSGFAGANAALVLEAP
jgi:3-oxoacyl-[acyl-carrier-protein] synthase II